ncbi:MAG: hypothetical protein ABSA47_15145 [Verrucomicrobiota bacterium]|jgi:hypothetical protein
MNTRKRPAETSTPRPKAQRLRATVWRWSVELHKKYDTLARRLRLVGIDVGRKTVVSAADVFRALNLPLEAARTRESTARASLLEAKVKARKADMAPVSDLESSLLNTLIPCRRRFLALPSEAAIKCNPTDPEHARLALEEWLEMVLPLLHEDNAKVPPRPSPH